MPGLRSQGQSGRTHQTNGTIAKAKTLSVRVLIDDWTRHGEIAAGLARDVLRHFGATVTASMTALPCQRMGNALAEPLLSGQLRA
jgi:hypothetical protein